LFIQLEKLISLSAQIVIMFESLNILYAHLRHNYKVGLAAA